MQWSVIQRLLYYAQLRKGAAEDFSQVVQEHADVLEAGWNELGLTNVSVFTCDLYVCVYAESLSVLPVWDWPESFDRYFEIWPSEPVHGDGSNERLHRLAIPMIDVFHDGVPSASDPCDESRQGKERLGSIARLKPEMVSSYIYYHYQRQEEWPESFNNSYIIGAMGRLLFSYHELPASVSGEKRSGLLNTRNTPTNWHEVMLPHFDPWDWADESQRLWMKMDRVFGH